MHVGVDRHEILLEIGAHDASGAQVGSRVFEERHREAPGHAAQVLAARGLCVEDAAGCERADHAFYPHRAEFGVDAHFGELRAEGVHRVLLLFAAGLGFGVAFDVIQTLAPQDVGVAFADRGVRA